MKLLYHSFFQLGFCTAFWQYFEWAYSLFKAGLIESPIWSGALGFPSFHHGYWGFILTYIMYLYWTWKDYGQCTAFYDLPWYKKLIIYLFSPLR